MAKSDKKKHFFIDCQILQTPARNRGMGKYISSLLKSLSAIERFNDEYDVSIIINKNLDVDQPVLDQLGQTLGDAQVVRLDLPVRIDEGDLQEKKQTARATITKFVSEKSENLTDSVYLLTAPFFVQFASVFPDLAIKKAVVVYDFIPHRISQKLKIFPDDIYYQHFDLFVDADLMLTISEFVRSDLIQVFSVDASRVATIDGGPFEVVKDSKEEKTVDTSGKYVLYPSAPIIHKNNINAAKAFELFNEKHDYTYSLLITSTFDDDTKNELNKLAKNIKFTGNVSESELTELYKNCSVVYFPSLSEGLGMPVLEGIMHSKPVVCSDIPVLTEISESLVTVNPLNVNSIAEGLEKATAKDFMKTRLGAYEEAMNKYSWDRSAKILFDSIEAATPKKRRDKKIIEFYAPDPSIFAPAARVIERLAIPLMENYEIKTHFTQQNRFLKTRTAPPSFTKYLTNGSNDASGDSDIKISVKRSFKDKSSVVIKIQNGSNQEKKTTTTMVKKDIDKYLGLEDWFVENRESVTDSIIEGIQ